MSLLASNSLHRPSTTQDEDDSSSSRASSLDSRPELDADRVNKELDSAADREKAIPNEDTEDRNLVTWDGVDDKENVRNMSKFRKWMICLILTSTTLVLTALSSAWGEANEAIAEHFGVGREVGDLGLSLFLLGLGVGPIISAPLSEFYGRQPMYCAGLLIFFAMQFPTAFPNNVAAAIAPRFFVSLGGSVFMSNVPGTFADLFDKSELGLPMTVFTLGPFLGPGVGPVFSGFIVQNAGYRWVFYVFIMWTFAMMLLIVFVVPETYGPVLLAKKARRLRKETGNCDLYAPSERLERSLLHALRDNCKRPIIMLCTEPVMIVLCVYTGFLLAVIYLFFVAFPVIFENTYGFSIEFVGTSFLGITIGMACGTATFPFWNRLYHKEIEKNGGVAEPEFRLPQMCVGSIIAPIGLFMFAWTIYSEVHWMVPIVASGIFGFGCYFTFNGILTYTVEAYRPFAASATACNVFVRCVIGASSPLFGVQMLNGMGYHWAMSLLAFVSLLLCPSAFIFRLYGKQLRMKSKHALH